jgi:BON domain
MPFKNWRVMLVSLPSDKIKAIVKNGWVTLEGTVDWQYQKTLAESAVKKLRGVTGIFNKIEVKPKVTPTEIKSKIEEAVRRSAELDVPAMSVELFRYRGAAKDGGPPDRIRWYEGQHSEKGCRLTRSGRLDEKRGASGDFFTLHSLNEFAQGSFGNILAGKGGNAPTHDNRFVQIESLLPRILARRFDLSTFGVTALLLWGRKSGVAIGNRSGHQPSYRPFSPKAE